MFKKTKWKFILLAMCSVLGILVLVLGFVNIQNYVSIKNDTDKTVQTILDNGGDFPTPNFDYKPIPGKDDELPFRSRFFTVEIKDNGERIYNLSRIAISQEAAEELANEAIENNDKRGFVEDFRYGFNNDRTLLVCLDATAPRTQIFKIFIFSLGFAAGGLFLFFILLYFSSGKIIKPLKVAVESQNQFITNSSHELKTPLTIINLNTELIEMKDGKSEATDNISHEVEKLKELVDEMMKLSKLNELTEIHLEKVDVNEIIAEAKEPFFEVYKTKNINFIEQLKTDIFIKTEKILFHELLRVCFDNASKYAKSFVKIETIPSSNELLIRISNDSEFTKEGNQNHLKGRFVRDEDARAEIDGSGIGLSLADKICEIIKAKLDIYGKNGIFNVEIRFKK